MTNAAIADVFREIAQLLAIQDENRFRILAYERAAEVVAGFPAPVADIYAARGRATLEELPGIGKDLALKTEELLTTGRLRYLTEQRRLVPRGLLPLLAVEGIGPKRARFLWKTFDVHSLRDLKRLLASGALERVSGWGTKSVAGLRHAIARSEQYGERMPLPLAQTIAKSLAESLRRSGLCAAVEIAGSIRRMRETIGDIDILVTTNYPVRVMDLFCAHSDVRRVIARGPTKANVFLRQGIEADLRVLAPDVFGAGLHYFTGSKAHNVHIRGIAKAKGLTVSEYGVFRGTKMAKGERIACRTEEDVFRTVDLPYIPPEIREDAGEIEAAAERRLPVLVDVRDLRGDLHVHSDVSDGSASMVEMLAAAKRAGYTYIAMTDHASAMGMVRGITASHQRRATSSKQSKTNISEYVKMVRAAARKVRDIHALIGAEVDILEDGRLYLPDEALAMLDWVVASVHAKFSQPMAQATARVIRAMEHPAVRAIGHPSTRIIGKREPIALDWSAIMDAAKQTGTFLEVNASWDRLDCDDARCRMAKERGVRVCVNTDAHRVNGFDASYGIATARRGWIEARDVVNSVPWGIFQKCYGKKRP